MSTTPTPETFAQMLDGIEAEHAADDDHPARKARTMDTTRQQLTPEQLADIRRRIDEAIAEHQRIKADIDARERQLTAAGTVDMTMTAPSYSRVRHPHQPHPKLTADGWRYIALACVFAVASIASAIAQVVVP